MIRVITATALAGLLASTATAQTRPEVAVIVLTLDQARQIQIKHGRRTLEVLGSETFGRYRMLEPTVPLEDFRSCENDSPRFSLEFCARYYLHHGLEPGSAPHVVVAFDDSGVEGPAGGNAGEMRVLCFGRGAEAADAAVQDTWLWPDSARLRGVRDWERDRDAVAACIDAALSEPPGVPRPRPL